MHRPKTKFTKLQILTHVAVLVPLALIVWDYTQGRLSANPIQAITLRTGKVALVLLVLSLACTPINTLFGFKSALRVRRALGLYAFMYAGLHLLIFTGLDYQFDFGLLWADVAEKRYIVVGLAAFLILLPLAVTSTKGWMKRLGKTWKNLHKLVYLAGLLAVTHFVWQVKSDIREPLLYGIVVVLLLIARIPGVKRFLSQMRQEIKMNLSPLVGRQN